MTHPVILSEAKNLLCFFLGGVGGGSVHLLHLKEETPHCVRGDGWVVILTSGFCEEESPFIGKG